MAAEGVPGLVGDVVEQARVDGEDADGDEHDRNPARPARVRRREPPHKGSEPKEEPDVRPYGGQRACCAGIWWPWVLGEV